MKNPTLSKLRKEFLKYGYAVSTNVLCPITFKKKWRYATSPINRGGAHGHFDTLEQLNAYLEQVENIRRIIDESL